MKTKTFSKKLSLNKTTVTNINDDQLNRVKGGIPGTYNEGSCDTVCYSYFYLGNPCPWPCNALKP